MDDYNAEVHLAKQLRDHAQKAPYAHAEKLLLGLAEAEETQVERLRAAIEGLGGSAAADALPPDQAKNHWARMVLDLEAKQAAGNRYLEQAIRWENLHPEIGELLRTLEREQQAHRQALRDLVARSDPHALN